MSDHYEMKIADLEEEIAELQKENEELKAWKAEILRYLPKIKGGEDLQK